MAHIAKGPSAFLGTCALEIQTIGVCYHLIQGECHKGGVRERHGDVLSYKITYKLLRITSTFSERALERLCKPNPTPQGEMEHGDTNWNGMWRTGWDSNPRRSFPLTPLAGERLKPLGHLSTQRVTMLFVSIQG